MRSWFPIAAALALLASFLEAPFAHHHRRDPAHRHAKVLPHPHFRILPPGNLALDCADADSDLQPVDWVVLFRDYPGPFVALVSAPLAEPAPGSSYELVRAPGPCAHDPPQFASSPARAPPV